MLRSTGFRHKNMSLIISKKLPNIRVIKDFATCFRLYMMLPCRTFWYHLYGSLYLNILSTYFYYFPTNWIEFPNNKTPIKILIEWDDFLAKIIFYNERTNVLEISCNVNKLTWLQIHFVLNDRYKVSRTSQAFRTKFFF